MKRIHTTTLSVVYAISLCLGLLGCNSFLDVELNTSEITRDKVFESDLNAQGAMSGIYRTMVTSTFAGGGADGVPSITGLYSDELHNYLATPGYLAFELNDVKNDDTRVLKLWAGAYQSIYQANDMLEGLSESKNISPSVKQQLKAEALFVRAYCYFYLVNIFGSVPIVKSTDYKLNAQAPKSDVAAVHAEILADLLEAESLISVVYPVEERVRPNLAAVRMLLSRVYLYHEDWNNAELNATKVIDDPEYVIEPDLSVVFKKESLETIWQLASETPLNTRDGQAFIIPSRPGSSSNILSEILVSKFSEDDLRFQAWVGKFNQQTGVLYYPFKYKIRASNQPITEHYVVLRLAETFLIRSEARVRLGDIEGSVADLDVIRLRAGIPLIVDTNPAISADSLLIAIQRERERELFTEGGHRFFDLKRTMAIDTVLGQLKPGWTKGDHYFPVPESEIHTNSNLNGPN